MTVSKRYWDANAFLGYFRNEHDKFADCESVLNAAADGRILIITSALTLAEVLYVKGKRKLDQSVRADIEKFFKAEFINVQNVTRRVAELARDLVWDENIRPKDAIHVATALITPSEVLNTFDEGLLKKNGVLGDDPHLRIEKPYEPTQSKIKFPE